MTPARPAPALALLALSASVAAGVILAALVIRFVIERAEAGDWAEPASEPGAADPVSPGDLAALHEEARRITRDGAG
jgi:hypothetical protein